jgi:hypothetical protein
MRCPEDAPKMPGFSSGGFATSPRHLSRRDACKAPGKIVPAAGKKTFTAETHFSEWH